MTKRSILGLALMLLVVASSVAVLAQQRGGPGGFGGNRQPGRFRPPVDLNDRNGVPEWEVDPHFRADLFTFVRIQWRSWRYSDTWLTDYPDSDLNFSFRLQQMTSLKTDPFPHLKQMKLTDERLNDYPFIYMLEVGSLIFEEDEVAALRKYLLNGGFLMVDDFWGETAWTYFKEQMDRVFPDRQPVELDITHPIFHCVFDLKEKPQVPGINAARSARARGESHVTWEGIDAKEPHYWAYFDDKGRMVAIICHNTDLGDGWEREGEEEWYFQQFSEKKSYPMGINIVWWAMTH
jgi:hypothetical protein